MGFCNKKLKDYASEAVIQGGHYTKIEDYFETLIKSAEDEFTEDNKNTLDDFLLERFIKVLQPNKEILADQLSQYEKNSQ